MQDATGTYTTTFDALSRPHTVVNPDAKMITCSYDEVGNRSFLVDPDGGRFTYVYDAANRIDYLVNPQGNRTSYVYDDAGRRTKKALANGTYTSFTYDDAGRITKVANNFSDHTAISVFNYAYDSAGNRTHSTELAGTRVTWTYDDTYQLLSDHRDGPNVGTTGYHNTYTYDPAGNRLTKDDGSRVTWSYDNSYQLTAEHRTGTSPYAQTFTYDAAANRTLKNEDGARTTYTYDLANQFQTSVDASGTTTYTFDADGNQQLLVDPAGARTTNTWDYNDKNTKVQLPTGTVATYMYNAADQRTSKEIDGEQTNFIWDQHNILLETDVADATKVMYTLEPQIYANLVSEHRKHGALWVSAYYQFDTLGSTRQLTDATTTVTDTWLYNAWGNIRSHSGSSSTPHLWIGQAGYYYDYECIQYAVRLRVYSSLNARWHSQDPLWPQSDWNLYRYAMNSPVNLVDPTGAFGTLRFLCIVRISGIPCCIATARVNCFGCTQAAVTAAADGCNVSCCNFLNCELSQGIRLPGDFLPRPYGGCLAICIAAAANCRFCIP